MPVVSVGVLNNWYEYNWDVLIEYILVQITNEWIVVMWLSWWFTVLSTQKSNSKDLHMISSKSYMNL